MGFSLVPAHAGIFFGFAGRGIWIVEGTEWAGYAEGVEDWISECRDCAGYAEGVGDWISESREWAGYAEGRVYPPV